MRHFYALFIFFEVLCLRSAATQQPHCTDSIKKLVSAALRNTAKLPDTININRINDLADQYFESHPDSTTYYGKLEIELSKKINYTRGIADGATQVASVNTFRGDYAASTQNYTTALNLYRLINNQQGISDSYIGLGRAQDYLGNYDAAIAYFNKALALRLKLNKPNTIADCYNIMGITYDNKGDFSKSLDCYFKALIINTKQKDTLAQADNYCNIGVIMQHLELQSKALNYFSIAYRIWKKLNDQQGISTAAENIGEVLMAQKQYQQAIGYLNTAAGMFVKLGDRDGISLINYDLGLYNFYTGRTAEALRYMELSLKSAGESAIKYNKAYGYEGLARIYNQQKDYTKAYRNALLAQQTAINLGSLKIKVDATLQLSAALGGLKRYKDAYAQHLLYTALKDSLANNETIHKLISYNLELDFEKNQKQRHDLQQQRDKAYKQKIADQKSELLIFAGIILILGILAFIYYRSRVRHKKINALLEEKHREVISHQETLNEQAAHLNESNLLKDRLIGVLAHDLRAPISTLRGLFTLMTNDNITAEEFAEMIPKVFNKLEHISDFLDTLLFWINTQVGKQNDNVKNFAIHTLVARETEVLEEALKNKELQLKTDLAPGTSGFADPNAIRIVIHNLLTNAIKFSNRGGQITITAVNGSENQLIFCITDEGVGMDDECLAGLFKTQVNSHAGTENEMGTGMGLLFCRDLVQKNGGKIWAESRLDNGTTMCFELPGKVK